MIPTLLLSRWLLCLACFASVSPAAAQQQLRVLTYNIHHGAGNDTCAPGTEAARAGADCGLDLERIAALILARQPDVVALQEVDRFWKRSGGKDQVQEFARLLKMQPCYGANLRLPADLPGNPDREYGTLTLSRLPILDCRNELLPKAAPAEEQRGLLRTEVRIGEQRVVVWNTHLHVRQADRLLQTARVAQAMRAETVPQVLLGDLNAVPGAPELEPLLPTMRDAWAERGEGAGFTSPAAPDRPARNRIDYVLVSGGLTVSQVEAITGPQTAMASDHYPVAAVLALAIP